MPKAIELGMKFLIKKTYLSHFELNSKLAYICICIYMYVYIRNRGLCLSHINSILLIVSEGPGEL